VLSGKHYIINSLHVVTGASVLVTSLVLTLRVHRARVESGESAGERAGTAGSPRADATSTPTTGAGGGRAKAGAHA
jgi:hypothetical protein